MLKLYKGNWFYEKPPKHPKCIEKINTHLNYLSKCYIVESTIFGACFYNGAKSIYWKYNNLITE
jgi:hypothetical protein